MNKKINRRDLLKTALLFSGASAVALAQEIFNSTALTRAVHGQGSNPNTYLPMVRNASGMPTPTPGVTPSPTRTSPPPGSRPRVVTTHSNSATSFSSGYFWQHVNQATVNSMVDRGVMELTGAGTLADAWRAIMSGYTQGQKVAIKVSFNNTNSCDFTSNLIDATVEPVIAVVRGLTTIGIPQADITVYDSTRVLPNRFMTPLRQQFANIKAADIGNGCNPKDAVSNQNFTFATPSGPGIIPHPISQTLVNAAHLINIPIMKFHGMAGYSLGLKNHYGSTTRVPSLLHVYSSLASPSYSNQYNPIVDLNRNPMIRDKTRLTLADCLFCAFRQGYEPSRWASFGGNFPNSLLFSLDPVAIDCVMADYLDHEATSTGKGIPPDGENFLKLAEQAGLGVYERANPWTNNYTYIDLRKFEIA